jgi:DNA-binding XRE family transcriptional regulator
MQMTPSQAARSLLEFLRNDHFAAPSDTVTRSMLESIERAHFETERQDWPVAQGVAQSFKAQEEWRYELLPHGEGQRREAMFLPAADLDKKLQTAMADYAKSLGDRDSDLMILAMARFAERAKTPDTKVTLSIDELMKALGYAKHKSASGESYKADQKATVRERFEALQDGFLSIKKAVKDKRGRSQDIESRVLIIEDRVGQADLDGRVKDWTAVTVRFGGAWAHRLFEPQGRMTALLQGKALEYDAIKERIEKRLLKRLGWYWKLNKNKPATSPRTVQTFITDDIGDQLTDYERSRDAIRFETAFDRLKRDGQIGAWRYDDGQPSIEEQTQQEPLGKGWFDKWIDRQIVVEAPQSLRMAYLERSKKPIAIDNNVIDIEPAKTTLGAKVRAFRLARQISGLQAAEMIGIDNGTLSKIEGGKRNPTDKQTKAIEAWMRDLDNRPDKLQNAETKKSGHCCRAT